jgi:error-prone DNA polymerase
VSSLDTSNKGLLARLPLADDKSPLREMSARERTTADYRGSGMTVGPHPITHLRPHLQKAGVLPAASLDKCRDGNWVKVAGQVIIRQRPPTAKGMCFVTLEDESGFVNVVITPDLYEKNRLTLIMSSALLVAGHLERRDGVTHLRGKEFESLDKESDQTIPSRDFR